MYWAAEELKDPRFYYTAVQHADTVRRALVREDGSSGHIACLNPHTGEVEEIRAGQGYSANSSWSRGQSWILYGFALSYHYTKGHIPLCDFRQPEQQALYRRHAEAMIRAVAENYCNWDPDTDSMVQGGKVQYHGGKDSTDLIYADYFLVEAVLRLMDKDFLIW